MDNCALIFVFSDKTSEMGHSSKHGTFSLTLSNKNKLTAITRGTVTCKSNTNIVSKGTNRLYLDLKQHNHFDLTK